LLLSVQGGVHSDAETRFGLIELARRAGPGGAMIVVDHPRNAVERAHAVARLERPLDGLME